MSDANKIPELVITTPVAPIDDTVGQTESPDQGAAPSGQVEHSAVEPQPTAEQPPATIETGAETLLESAPSDPNLDQTQQTAPEEIKYEQFNIPDGFSVDNEKLGEYQQLLAQHRLPQEIGQKFIDMHIQALQNVVNEAQSSHANQIKTQRENWRNQVKSDDQLGGAGFQTTLQSVAKMRDMFYPQERIQEFNDFLRETGAGDHPVFWRLLNNVAKKFGEPVIPTIQPQPPKDRGPKPGDRKTTLYDHPSSQKYYDNK